MDETVAHTDEIELSISSQEFHAPDLWAATTSRIAMSGAATCAALSFNRGNAGPVLRIVHQGLVFDNSGAEPRPVFEMREGEVFNLADEIPAWAAALLEQYTRHPE